MTKQRSLLALFPSILIFICLALIPSYVWANELVLRIPVNEEGVYRITYNEIGYHGQPYGIDPKQIDPRHIHLYNREQDIAVFVAGEEDGRFDQGDYIEFYGIPVQPGDPEYKYTEENIYWLKINTAPPVRTTSWTSTGSGTPESFFLHTYHVEKNWHYWETMPNGEGLDHWFWGNKIPAGSKRDYTFYLSRIASTTKTASVRVYLHGRTDDSVNPDHRTSITLNGNYLGDVVWDGQKPVTHSFDNIPQSYLNADSTSNTLTIEELGNPDAVVDSIFFNWMEVDYHKKFIAEGDRLKFTARGNGVQYFSITHFPSPNIQVFDVSNPSRVRRLANPSVTSTDNSYTVNFSDNLSGEATYLAIAGVNTMKDFTALFYLTLPSLKTNNNGADHLIITHKDFKDAVSALAQHREGQGYRVKVVTTQEIYDSFSGGIFTPHAIKDFLKYAYESWRKPAPEFVLLIGDANLDYKDNWKTGQKNFVPAYLVETTLVGETPSDHWYATVSGDDPLPDLLIGRIPAKTAADIHIMVNKIIAYETQATGDWLYKVLVATDDRDPRFEEYSEEWIIDHLPGNYTPLRAHAARYEDKGRFELDFMNNLNNGVLMTTYFGHGNIGGWEGSQDVFLLTSEDAPSLVNVGMTPFIAALNCLNGLFALPGEGKWITLPDGEFRNFIPITEALLFQEKRGALAMWSPAAFAYPSEQRWIGHELFSGLFEQGNNVLGSVTTLAKVNAYIKKGIYKENLDVFTFFGDPATRLTLDIKKGDNAGSGGGGCFIATAAYGSYIHPYVKILRDFRDQVLLSSEGGRKIVELYYHYSPPAADWIAGSAWTKGMTQVVLIPVIFYAWLVIGAPVWIQGIFLALVLLCWLGLLSMIRTRRTSLVALIILCFSGLSMESVVWAGDSDLQVTYSGSNGLVVELSLPPYQVMQKSVEGNTYHQIEVDGYGFIKETGNPLVPMRGALIAIPEDGEITIAASAGEYRTISLNIGPAGGHVDNSAPQPNPQVYEKDAFYPGPVAARGFTGYMRDQKVMQILFYPVQYNPVTRELRIYEKIKLTVGFGNTAKSLEKSIPGEEKDTHSRSGTSEAYEKLLRGLILNYPQKSK